VGLRADVGFCRSGGDRCEALTFVRMENLKDCRVYCGPVAGPVYVESCTGCTFVLASRQVSRPSGRERQWPL
jgi:hypothetical protein